MNELICEELELLSEIFFKELLINERPDAGTDVTVSLTPATGGDTALKYVSLDLLISVPAESYPGDADPNFALRKVRGVSEENQQRILDGLCALAAERRGECVLYECIEYVQTQLTENNMPSGDCPICLESFESGYCHFTITECTHYFHMACLNEHLIQQDKNEVPRCPTCRLELDVDYVDALQRNTVELALKCNLHKKEEITFDPALFHHQLKYKAEFERQKANNSFFSGDPNVLDLRTRRPEVEEQVVIEEEEEEEEDDAASSSHTNERLPPVPERPSLINSDGGLIISLSDLMETATPEPNGKLLGSTGSTVPPDDSQSEISVSLSHDGSLTQPDSVYLPQDDLCYTDDESTGVADECSSVREDRTLSDLVRETRIVNIEEEPELEEALNVDCSSLNLDTSSSLEVHVPSSPGADFSSSPADSTLEDTSPPTEAAAEEDLEEVEVFSEVAIVSEVAPVTQSAETQVETQEETQEEKEEEQQEEVPVESAPVTEVADAQTGEGKGQRNSETQTRQRSGSHNKRRGPRRRGGGGGGGGGGYRGSGYRGDDDSYHHQHHHQQSGEVVYRRGGGGRRHNNQQHCRSYHEGGERPGQEHPHHPHHHQQQQQHQHPGQDYRRHSFSEWQRRGGPVPPPSQPRFKPPRILRQEALEQAKKISQTIQIQQERMRKPAPGYGQPSERQLQHQPIHPQQQQQHRREENQRGTAADQSRAESQQSKSFDVNRFQQSILRNNSPTQKH